LDVEISNARAKPTFSFRSRPTSPFILINIQSKENSPAPTATNLSAWYPRQGFTSNGHVKTGVNGFSDFYIVYNKKIRKISQGQPRSGSTVVTGSQL
jgi:hypothetical protein